MKIIKQSAYETCLPCSLMMMVGKRGRQDEIEIWKHGWKFNYLIGQLNFVSEKYKIKIRAYIENKYYFSQLQKQKGRSVELENKKIDLRLIKNLLNGGKVIVYLDIFVLFGVLHAPHFVVATKIEKDKIEIADPADGKLKQVSFKMLSKGIKSLRKHLKYSPVLVIMYK